MKTIPHGFVVAALLALGGTTAAQSVLTRDFERMFFSRREAWIERLWQRADAERRAAAAPLLGPAVLHRGFADSLAGQRCTDLTAAAAVLAGLDPKDRAFAARFNFYLIALPEVVDPEKTDGDRVKLGEVSRRIFPLLKPVHVADAKALAADNDRVWLTARGVFGAHKPESLRLRLQLRDAAGKLVGDKERGDSDDPSGWLVFDLVERFSLAGAKPGRFAARAEIGVDGQWPRREDPPVRSAIDLAPGYHRRMWELLAMQSKLTRLEGKEKPAEHWLGRLDLLTREALRPLLGDDFEYASHAVESQRAGLALGRRLLAGEAPDLPDAGDMRFALRLAQGEAKELAPFRIVWGSRNPRQRLRLIAAPSGNGLDYVTHALGLSADELHSGGTAITVVLASPTPEGYLQGVLAFVRKHFADQVAGAPQVIGVLDGGTRARFSVGRLKSVDELVLVGAVVPDIQLLRDDSVARVRVIPAYGQPAAVAKTIQAMRPAAPSQVSKVAIERVAMRSLAKAMRLALRPQPRVPR